MAVYDDRLAGATARAGRLVNYAGAAVSLTLMIGVGVWGYKLIMRDVSGIPVVRAMEGAMRIAPDNPGGEVARNVGLAVNAVAAVGEAAPPEDRLALAPRTQDLTVEDLEVQPAAEATELAILDDPEALPTTVALPDATTAPEPADPVTPADMLALADQLASGVTPLTDLAEGATVDPTVLLEGTPAKAPVEVIPTDVPGVARSVRPTVRPLGLEVAAAALTGGEPATAAAPAVIPAEASTEIAVTTADLPVGTKLVQLGAYPTPQEAADEWSRLSGLFAEYMTGKDRIIQVASSGGQTFYRLRAMGFADLVEARRFCVSVESGSPDCIPVVVR